MTEYVLALAMLDTSCGKAAREVRALMSDEFGEVEEPVPPGSVGSSTMPQKRNPKLCQDIMADDTEVRSLVPLTLEAMLGDHEADGSRSVIIDRALTRALELTGDILVRLQDVVTGLRVFPERMRRNLDLSGGLIMSESLMLTLGREIGRQRAHDVVYEAAQEAATSGEPFASILARDEDVAARLGADRLAELLDPTRYTGDSARQAEEQAARALRVAGELREASALAGRANSRSTRQPGRARWRLRHRSADTVCASRHRRRIEMNAPLPVIVQGLGPIGLLMVETALSDPVHSTWWARSRSTRTWSGRPLSDFVEGAPDARRPAVDRGGPRGFRLGRRHPHSLHRVLPRPRRAAARGGGAPGPARRLDVRGADVPRRAPPGDRREARRTGEGRRAHGGGDGGEPRLPDGRAARLADLDLPRHPVRRGAPRAGPVHGGACPSSRRSGWGCRPRSGKSDATPEASGTSASSSRRGSSLPRSAGR